jgi:hypothetical protein
MRLANKQGKQKSGSLEKNECCSLVRKDFGLNRSKSQDSGGFCDALVGFVNGKPSWLVSMMNG